MTNSDSEPHVHSHSHSELEVPVSPRFKKVILALVGIVLLATAAGALLTWPDSADLKKAKDAAHEAIDFPNDQYAALVDDIDTKDCVVEEVIGEGPRSRCKYVLFDVAERKVSNSEGKPCKKNQPYLKDTTKPLRYCVQQTFDPDGTTTPDFKVGQKVVVSYRNADGIDPQFRYSFADQDRRWILVLVAILFLFTVVIFGVWRGLLAVVGLIVSLIVIGIYILPALVSGENGVLVALIGGTAVAAVALYISHGFYSSTHIAFLSSIGSVLAITFLAQLFFVAGRFTGFVSEEANFLSVADTSIDLRGLLIAGAILASLGALDDMTVTQVAVVSEIHNARPDYKFAQLWKSAVRIGRDHVASTVNTLALAYVGTSLALMLLFVVSKQSLIWVLNSESVAVQIVGALVGSFGLIISVPLSTALAAYAVHKSGEHDHHSHGHDHDHKEIEDDQTESSEEIKTEVKNSDIESSNDFIDQEKPNSDEDDFWKGFKKR